MFIIFFVFLCIIGGLIISSITNSKDGKNEQSVQQQLSQIPPIVIRSPQMSDLRKLFMEKAHSIDVFSYNNKQVEIRMRNGDCVSGNIDNMDVTFSKNGFVIETIVKCQGKKIEFYYYEEQFNSNQWNTIYNILLLAGVTRNKQLILS